MHLLGVQAKSMRSLYGLILKMERGHRFLSVGLGHGFLARTVLGYNIRRGYGTCFWIALLGSR